METATTQMSVIERLMGEEQIPVTDAAKLYNVTHSTAVRHTSHGLRLADGRLIKLEAMRCGKKLWTSKQAVMRFLATQNEEPEAVESPPMRSPSKRERDAAAAGRELDKLLGT